VNFQKQTVSIWCAENNDEGNAIIFHHESETVENCCTNRLPYFEDSRHFDMSVRDDNGFNCITVTANGKYGAGSEGKLNNELNWEQPTTSLEIIKNIFPSSSSSSKNVLSISSDLRVFEKTTNLNRNSVNLSQNLRSMSSSTSSLYLSTGGGTAGRSYDPTKLNKRNNTATNDSFFSMSAHDIRQNMDLVVSHYNKPTSINLTSQNRLNGNGGSNHHQHQQTVSEQLQHHVAMVEGSTVIQMDGIGESSSTTNLNSLNATTPMHLRRLQHVGLNGLLHAVRSRAKKCKKLIQGKRH
jgi:hypothetical protein